MARQYDGEIFRLQTFYTEDRRAALNDFYFRLDRSQRQLEAASSFVQRAIADSDASRRVLVDNTRQLEEARADRVSAEFRVATLETRITDILKEATDDVNHLKRLRANDSATLRSLRDRADEINVIHFRELESVQQRVNFSRGMFESMRIERDSYRDRENARFAKDFEEVQKVKAREARDAARDSEALATAAALKTAAALEAATAAKAADATAAMALAAAIVTAADADIAAAAADAAAVVVVAAAAAEQLAAGEHELAVGAAAPAAEPAPVMKPAMGIEVVVAAAAAAADPDVPVAILPFAAAAEAATATAAAADADMDQEPAPVQVLANELADMVAPPPLLDDAMGAADVLGLPHGDITDDPGVLAFLNELKERISGATDVAAPALLLQIAGQIHAHTCFHRDPPAEILPGTSYRRSISRRTASVQADIERLKLRINAASATSFIKSLKEIAKQAEESEAGVEE
jgi:hypothetical protein